MQKCKKCKCNGASTVKCCANYARLGIEIKPQCCSIHRATATCLRREKPNREFAYLFGTLWSTSFEWVPGMDAIAVRWETGIGELGTVDCQHNAV